MPFHPVASYPRPRLSPVEKNTREDRRGGGGGVVYTVKLLRRFSDARQDISPLDDDDDDAVASQGIFFKALGFKLPSARSNIDQRNFQILFLRRALYFKRSLPFP